MGKLVLLSFCALCERCKMQHVTAAVNHDCLFVLLACCSHLRVIIYIYFTISLQGFCLFDSTVFPAFLLTAICCCRISAAELPRFVQFFILSLRFFVGFWLWGIVTECCVACSVFLFSFDVFCAIFMLFPLFFVLNHFYTTW